MASPGVQPQNRLRAGFRDGPAPRGLRGGMPPDTRMDIIVACRFPMLLRGERFLKPPARLTRRGFANVETQIVPCTGTGERPTYAVRSNLLNGLPQAMGGRDGHAG